MAFLKDEMIELSVLSQKWEKEYIDALTEIANDFQEKTDLLKQILDKMILGQEENQVADKKLQKKLLSYKKKISQVLKKLKMK